MNFFYSVQAHLRQQKIMKNCSCNMWRRLVV